MVRDFIPQLIDEDDAIPAVDGIKYEVHRASESEKKEKSVDKLFEEFMELEKRVKADDREGIGRELVDLLEVLDVVEKIIVSSSPISSDYGGIDFNSRNLNLKEQGRSVDINLTNFPNIDTSIVDGVTPVIINVTPITNFPLLLGLASE